MTDAMPDLPPGYALHWDQTWWELRSVYEAQTTLNTNPETLAAQAFEDYGRRLHRAGVVGALKALDASVRAYAQSLADEQDGKAGVPIQTAVGTCLLRLTESGRALRIAEGGREMRHVIGNCEACGGLYHPAAPECSTVPDPNPEWARAHQRQVMEAHNAYTLVSALPDSDPKFAGKRALQAWK